MRYKSLFCLFMLLSKGLWAQELLITCPHLTDIKTTAATQSWAKYHYSAAIPIDFPDVGNQLLFIGDGDAERAIYFTGATFTDMTFLCLYNYHEGLQSIVLYEIALYQYVSRCYFKTTTVSDCQSNDPDVCKFTCDISNR